MQPSLLAACLAFPAVSSSSPMPPGETVALESRPVRSWQVVMPAERSIPVGSGIAFAHAGGPRFIAHSEGERLRVDVDGDGTLDALVEGEEGFVTLTQTAADGRVTQYSARLTRTAGQPWHYTFGSVRTGEFRGTKLQLVDQNLNGRFDDFGEDALVVGRDVAASFLSRVVSIEGQLYELEVASDGTSCTLSPHLGESGVLDLGGAFRSQAKLHAAIVVSDDGRNSFSVARATGGLRVPAGAYRLHSGQIVLSDAHATIKGGSRSRFEVASGAIVRPEWGGPVRAEFAVQRDGDQLGFTPWDIWYYGALGEEYSNFMPLGTSPEFTIRERQSGDVLVYTRFPGNC